MPFDPYQTEVVVQRGKLPTAKLLSAAVTMAVLYVLKQFVDVDQELENIVNLVVPLVVAYFVPNSLAPGGVPDTKAVVETRPLGDDPDKSDDPDGPGTKSWRP